MSSFWKNRKVFITGATGFVGAHLARHLLAQGANIFCLGRHQTGQSSLEILELKKKVKIIKGSLEDLALLKRILSEFEIETVFHLAAQALVGAAHLSPIPTFETNIRGTYLLLEASRLAPTVKSIVVASSNKASGSQNSNPYPEDFPLQSRFPYEVSKACSDLISQSFALTYDLPVTIARLANIYGEGDLNLSRIIPGTIVSVLRNESPIIRGDGTSVREFIHVDDVARGILLLAERIEETKGEAFNFGTNEPVQMLNLVEKILKKMGKENDLQPEILLKNKIEGEIGQQGLSTKKVLTKLGWKTEIFLEVGLNRTIEWYRTNFAQIT
jgi:CDP-glucose 4,6-dehydratase